MPIPKKILEDLKKYKTLKVTQPNNWSLSMDEDAWATRAPILIRAFKDAGYKSLKTQGANAAYIYCGNSRIHIIGRGRHFRSGIFKMTHNGKKWCEDRDLWHNKMIGVHYVPFKSFALNKIAEIAAKWLDKHANNKLVKKKPEDAVMPPPCTFKPGGLINKEIGRIKLKNEIIGCHARSIHTIEEHIISSGVKRFRAAEHDGDPDKPVYIRVDCSPVNTYAAYFTILYNPNDETFYPVKYQGNAANITDRRKTDYADTDRLCKDDLVLIKKAVEDFLSNQGR